MKKLLAIMSAFVPCGLAVAASTVSKSTSAAWNN
jgi:hypothetical protein